MDNGKLSAWGKLLAMLKMSSGFLDAPFFSLGVLPCFKSVFQMWSNIYGNKLFIDKLSFCRVKKFPYNLLAVG